MSQRHVRKKEFVSEGQSARPTAGPKVEREERTAGGGCARAHGVGWAAERRCGAQALLRRSLGRRSCCSSGREYVMGSDGTWDLATIAKLPEVDDTTIYGISRSSPWLAGTGESE
eukprot:2124116-Prymnesium_polylepis.1